jgi:enoyl-CoA hydratase/carnithine racemase
MGLVDVLTSQDRVRAEALQLAAEIAANAPLAITSVRATLRGSLADEVRSATEHELKEQQWLRATEDAAEGIRSVAERRAGQFQGR